MKRSAALLVVLAAGCGQRAGVHTFTAPFREPVAESREAHGASARTRDAANPRHVELPAREHVPGGHTILEVGEPSGGTVTWPQWGALLLDRLDAPRCANNLIVIVAWAAQENTRAGWNPLATTLDMPGATLFNGASVKNYGSLEQGLEATVLTLQQGFTEHGYGVIVRALRACADPFVTARAINASDWCRGCAGGAYVTAVVGRVVRSYVEASN